MKGILVLPVGRVDSEVLGSISHGVEMAFGLKVKVGGDISVPQDSYNARRRQYNSPSLIRELGAAKEEDYDIVLGVTDEDLYAPRLNFVFGEANAMTGAAVISLARLRAEFYDLPPNKTLFHARAVKEAIHELGHIFCLDHCPNPKCIMYFSNGIADTDRKGPGFCKICRDILGI